MGTYKTALTLILGGIMLLYIPDILATQCLPIVTKFDYNVNPF